MERMLVVTTPAQSRALVTIDELKADLGPLAATLSDEEFTALAESASATISAACNVVLVAETVVESFWLDQPRDRLFLERTPIAAGATVSIGGELLAPEGFVVDPNVGALRKVSATGIEPWPCGMIVVTYTGGFAENAIPPALKTACLSVARRMNAGRSRDPFLKSEEIPGVLNRTFWVGAVGSGATSALNPDEALLLSDFIRRRIGA